MHTKRRDLRPAIALIARTVPADQVLDRLLDLTRVSGTRGSEAGLWMQIWAEALKRPDLAVLARAQVQVMERRDFLADELRKVLPDALMMCVGRLARASAISAGDLDTLFDAAIELSGATVKNSARRARIAHSTAGAVAGTLLQMSHDDLDAGLNVGTCAACSAHQLMQQAFDDQDAARIIELSTHVRSGRWTPCTGMQPPIGPIALFLVPAARHLGQSLDDVALPAPGTPTHLDPAESEAGRLLLRATRDLVGVLDDLQRPEAPASAVSDDIAWTWWYAAVSWVLDQASAPEVPGLHTSRLREASAAARSESWMRVRRLDLRNGNQRWSKRMELWERWMGGTAPVGG